MMPMPRPSATPGTPWPKRRLGFMRVAGVMNQVRMTSAAFCAKRSSPVK